jgi:hypothetical protein
MPNSSDDARDSGRRSPADHFVVKHDAVRSQAVQALVRNILIVGATDGDARVIISLLRAALGRHVEARVALGLEAASDLLARQPPNIVVLKHTQLLRSCAEKIIRGWRQAGVLTPAIVICEQLSASEAIAMRQWDVLDVIELDDLDSVRLFEALLKAVVEPSPPPEPLAWARR